MENMFEHEAVVVEMDRCDNDCLDSCRYACARRCNATCVGQDEACVII